MDEDQYSIIKKSDLFDEKWFKKFYSLPDDTDPIIYFLENCISLGLNPSPNFDTEWYLNEYTDVKNAGINPLIHYIQYGKEELRLPKPFLHDQIYKEDYSIICNSDLFDEKWFKEFYSLTDDIDPIIYFLENCINLNLNPSPNFNTKKYLYDHPEIKNDGINPLIHYINSINGKIIKIAIFGCCVSRDAFTTKMIPNYKDFFKIVTMSTRASMISLMQNPINFDEASLTILPENPSNNFKKNCIVNDMKKTFLNVLIEKDIDYLIIDNYLEVLFGIICFNKGIISYNPDLELTEYYKKLGEFTHLRISDNPNQYFEMWSKNCDLFFNFLKNKCPNLKIILNNAKPFDKFLNEDGSVFIDANYTKHCDEIIPHLNKLNNYIKENYNVKSINYENSYYLDENHMWGKGPVHYNKNFYQDFLDKIKKIIIDDYYYEILNLSNNHLNFDGESSNIHNDNKFVNQYIKNLKKEISIKNNELNILKQQLTNLEKELSDKDNYINTIRKDYNELFDNLNNIHKN